MAPSESLSTLPPPTPDAVRALRESAGWTQAEAAAAVRLSSATKWSEYERGIRSPDKARWELALLRAGLHPTLRLAAAAGERHPPVAVSGTPL